MKLTVKQLRHIIKEEVQNVMASEPLEDASLEIPDVSVHAEGAGMSVKEFCDMVRQMGRKYGSVEVGPANALDSGDGYSSEYDSLLVMGNRSDLESLARELDEELMGGAQSIGEEDSFVNFIQDL